MKRLILCFIILTMMVNPAMAFGETITQENTENQQLRNESISDEDMIIQDFEMKEDEENAIETENLEPKNVPSTASEDSYEELEEEPTEDPEPVTHPVNALKAVSKNFRQITLSWTCDDYNGQYKIYRVQKNDLIYVGKTYKKKYTVRNLKAGTKYSFVVESDTLSDKVSATVLMQKTGSLSLVKSGKKRWDVRIEAGEKLFGYDTIQGACSYDGYAYMALYNRNYERIKIVMVDLVDMEVVMVSKPLRSHCHGNTLTYNPQTNEIIAVCGNGGKKTILFVDADTLEQKSKKVFKIDRSLIKTTYYGVAGVSYNNKYDKYILKVRGSSNRIVKFSSDWETREYVPIKGNRSYLLSQGLYTRNDYMYDVQSFKNNYRYNLITLRTLKGELAGRMMISSKSTGKLLELENVFYDNVTKSWYASFYRSLRKNGKTDRENYLYKIKNMW